MDRIKNGLTEKIILVKHDFITSAFEPYIKQMACRAIKCVHTKLSALKLKAGNRLSMEYDYGAGWEFEIKLLSVTRMERGRGRHYPYVAGGKGKGIIEDTSPYELAEIIEKTNKDGILPKITDGYSQYIIFKKHITVCQVKIPIIPYCFFSRISIRDFG